MPATERKSEILHYYLFDTDNATFLNISATTELPNVNKIVCDDSKRLGSKEFLFGICSTRNSAKYKHKQYRSYSKLLSNELNILLKQSEAPGIKKSV